MSDFISDIEIVAEETTLDEYMDCLYECIEAVRDEFIAETDLDDDCVLYDSDIELLQVITTEFLYNNGLLDLELMHNFVERDFS